jgi:hypothetical protein
MPVLALPDIKGAVIAHLRASSEIAALASTRVSGRVQAAWTLPGYAVLVDGPKGGPGELGAGLYGMRFDLRCYGPDDRTAMMLWRTVNAYLLVPDGSRAVSFYQAQTRIHAVHAEGGPIGFVDPDTDWPSTDSGYVFTFSEVPSP